MVALNRKWNESSGGQNWAGEKLVKLVLHKLRFSSRFRCTLFPPCEGGGGVVPARPVTRSSHALSLSVLSHQKSLLGLNAPADSCIPYGMQCYNIPFDVIARTCVRMSSSVNTNVFTRPRRISLPTVQKILGHDSFQATAIVL